MKSLHFPYIQRELPGVRMEMISLPGDDALKQSDILPALPGEYPLPAEEPADCCIHFRSRENQQFPLFCHDAVLVIRDVVHGG